MFKTSITTQILTRTRNNKFIINKFVCKVLTSSDAGGIPKYTGNMKFYSYF